jgi:hypothetical protein
MRFGAFLTSSSISSLVGEFLWRLKKYSIPSCLALDGRAEMINLAQQAKQVVL